MERISALTLGVLATRLRARHGSMGGARAAWAKEADAHLRPLELPELRLKLRSPARQKRWRGTRCTTILRIDDHELLVCAAVRAAQNLGWAGM